MPNKNENELLKQIEELKNEIKKLKSRKKYGLVWEEKEEQVVLDCQNKLPILKEVKSKAINTDKDKPVNILIEGDNYHSLSVLNYTHKEKIDVIYIDPPYNTGAKDWKYNNDYVDGNDAYRHSKWISMMSNRLQIAKNLLKKDGILICAIDENEFNRLGLLIEEIFANNELHCITIVHNPRGIQGKNFSYTHEYAFFSLPNGIKSIAHRKISKKEIVWRNLRDNGGGSLRVNAKNCFYPMIIENNKIIGFGDVVPNDKHPKKQTVKINNQYFVYPIDSKGIERKWRYARQSVEQIKDLLRAKKTRGGYEIELGKDFGTVRTVWQDSRYDANEYGTKLVHALVPNTHFDFPKSVYNVYDCIAPILYNKKDAIILDFFAGSGTTGHAVSILNKEDNGNRKFILCTNNENNISVDVCYPRIKSVIKGVDTHKDITGIKSNLRYYKTDFVDTDHINKITDEGKIKLSYQAGEMIALRENVLEETEKNDWWQIFQDDKQVLAIYFKEDKSKLQKLVDKLNKNNTKIILYIFSWGKNEYKNEFHDYKNIRVEDIPEPILEVYKEINKL